MKCLSSGTKDRQSFAFNSAFKGLNEAACH